MPINGRSMPHRLAAGLLLRNLGYYAGPVDVMFGTGTGFSRSTSVFLVSVITKTPHTHIHSHTTLNQNLPTKVTVFGNKESSRQNNTLITFNLQNVNVASKRHSLDILHCLIEEKNTFRGKAMWDSSCAQNSGLGFIRLRWCGVPKPLSANSFCSSSETRGLMQVQAIHITIWLL